MPWIAAGGVLLGASWVSPLRMVDLPNGGRVVHYRDGVSAAVSVATDERYDIVVADNVHPARSGSTAPAGPRVVG